MEDDWNENFADAPAAPGAVDLTGGGVTTPPVEGFDTAMQETPPEVQQMLRPAASPAEVEIRRTRWARLAHQFQTNPNLQRAMLLTAAQLAQPVQPGQTHVGQAANAAVVGMNAYQLGQKEQLAQAAGMRKEGREERALAAQETTAAGVEAERRARLPGVAAEAELKAKTLPDAIKSARLNMQKLETEIDEAKKDIAVKDLERDSKAIELLLKKPNIAESVKRGAELEKARIDDLLAKHGLTKAQERKTAAEASIAEQEAKLTPQERAQARATTAPTAEQAKWKLLSDAWDKSPTLKSQHPDREAYLADAATSVRENPAQMLKYISEAIDATDKKDPIMPELQRIRQEMTARFGSAGARTPTGDPTDAARERGRAAALGSEPRPKTRAERDALKPGTWYIAPDGTRHQRK